MQSVLAQGTLAILKDAMVIVGSICTLLIAGGGLILAVKRWRRDQTKEEVTAAEELTRLTARVETLESQQAMESEAHDAIRADSSTGIEALQTQLQEIRQKTGTLDAQCERHKALLRERDHEEVRKSVRRINGRCDDLKDRIDAARERADDRFVQATQHEKDLAQQVQALDTIQHQVNNLVKLVSDLLK